MCALAVACRGRITHNTQHASSSLCPRGVAALWLLYVCKQESSEKKSTEAEIFYTFFAQLLFFSFYFCFLHFFLCCVVPAMQSSGRCIKREKTQSTAAAAVAAAACLQVAPGGVQHRQTEGQRDGQTDWQCGP